MLNTEKIKILVAVPSLECGGLEKNVAFLVNNINPDKFEVFLVIINNRNPYFPIKIDKEKVNDLAAAGARKAMPALIKITKEINPDILLTASNHLNLLCAIYKHKFPKRMKLLARESSIVSQNVKFGKFPWMYNQMLKHFYKKTDVLVCQSEYMKTDLHDNYGIPDKKMRVINNAVVTPDPPKGNVHSIPVFISVGRLRPEKGMTEMLQAVSKLDFPFLLHIVGDGPERNRLEYLAVQLGISEKISFHGNRETPFAIEEKPGLFLITSQYEGFPNAVLEAGALGIPTIAYRAPGGIVEIIRDGENGFLVNPGDQVEFAQKIKQALNYPFNPRDISQRTLANYSPAPIIKKWENLFEDILIQR